MTLSRPREYQSTCLKPFSSELQLNLHKSKGMNTDRSINDAVNRLYQNQVMQERVKSSVIYWILERYRWTVKWTGRTFNCIKNVNRREYKITKTTTKFTEKWRQKVITLRHSKLYLGDKAWRDVVMLVGGCMGCCNVGRWLYGML
jgi:hypothetical protein